MNHSESTVSSIMTKDVITVQNSDSLHKIQEIFDHNSIHHVVVLNHGIITGIISKNDILNYLMNDTSNTQLQVLSELKAGDIMTADPITIDSDDTIGLAADIILSNKLHSLPVVEDGKLAGILTSHDLLRHSYMD